MRKAVPESRMISKRGTQSCAHASSSSIPSTASSEGVRVRQAKGAFPNSVEHREDLAAAGIEREDAEGRVVDLRALRHTSATWLAVMGTHARTAQMLARHAAIETTRERGTAPRKPEGLAPFTNAMRHLRKTFG